MFLHFVPDNGFLNYFIEVTEGICGPGKNKYVICEGVTPLSQPTRSKIKFDFVKTLKYNSAGFKEFVGDVSQYDKIFIHFLTDVTCDFIIENINTPVKFYWMFWGADLYKPLSHFAHLIYDNYSLGYYKSHTTYNKTGNIFFDFLKYSKRTLFRSYYDNKSESIRRKAIERIDYFCHYNSRDLELLNQYYPTKAKFQPFFYFEYDYSALGSAGAESVLAIRNKLGFSAETIIQVGHSASLSNNHISILNDLSKQPLENSQVICPLSYGDFEYGKEVVATGKKLLRDKFIPLTTYLSKDEYLAFLSSVDIAIMNHKRTEAAGNIFMMLAMERTVSVNPASNLYFFLKTSGVELFQFESNSSIVETDADKRSKNKKIILDIFSKENAIKNMKDICSE